MEWYDAKVDVANKMILERQKEDVEKNVRF